MDPYYVSISDIQNFQRCRRKWNLTSVNRQGLKHKSSPSMALSIGSAVHVGVEALYTTGSRDDALTATREYMEGEREKKVSEYKERTGYDPTPFEMTDFNEAYDLAMGMVDQYIEKYGINPLDDYGLKQVASEITFKIPLPIENREVYFVGTWDELARDEEANTTYLVERKTYTMQPNPRDLQHHLQLVGYAWAYQVVTGERIGGVLFDGLSKRLIRPPKVLKDGSLSTDKRASVTLQSFLTTMEATGASPFDEKHGARYTEYLTFLEDRERADDHRFFYRDRFVFPQDQLENFGKTLLSVTEEMLGPVVYPTFSRDGCKDCYVKDLCYTQEKGFGIEGIINTRYERKTYGTMDTIRAVEPAEVNSLDDLINAVKGGQ